MSDNDKIPTEGELREAWLRAGGNDTFLEYVFNAGAAQSQQEIASLSELLQSADKKLAEQEQEIAQLRSEEAELLSKLHNSEVLAGKLYKDNVELIKKLEVAEAMLKEQEMAISLYREDVERIWVLFPELRNTDAHYDIFEAAYEKIRTSHKEGYNKAIKDISEAPVVATIKRLNGATVDLNLGGLGRHVVDTGNELELKIGDELIIRPTIKE